MIGGSQGARALNEVVPRALVVASLGTMVTVWHQCGPANVEATRDGYASLGTDIEITGYIEDMGAAYAWTDVALCRAGAMTVAELAAAGVASILVPFPVRDGRPPVPQCTLSDRSWRRGPARAGRPGCGVAGRGPPCTARGSGPCRVDVAGRIRRRGT